MHAKSRRRLAIPLMTLCVGAFACTKSDTSSNELPVAEDSPTAARNAPCDEPVPLYGKRMRVEPDFPADVLIIIRPGPDGIASQATYDELQKKYDVELMPYLSRYEDLIGGYASLTEAQVATMRCESDVLAITYRSDKFHSVD